MNATKPASPSSLEAPASPEAPAAPKRLRRSSELFDVEGNPVQITLTCLCCKEVKPLAAFGLRKMPNGVVRNQPWCRACRSGKSAEAKAAPTQGEAAPARGKES